MALAFLPQTQYDLYGLWASIRSGTFNFAASTLRVQFPIIAARIDRCDFDWHEKALLVIWEARLIIQLPIGVVFLYPSALFIHFNLNISNFMNHIVTTTNGPWPTPGSPAAANKLYMDAMPRFDLA
ncbi:hypothetical protein V8D89_004254 [Ganoderma adspersum]